MLLVPGQSQGPATAQTTNPAELSFCYRHQGMLGLKLQGPRKQYVCYCIALGMADIPVCLPTLDSLDGEEAGDGE